MRLLLHYYILVILTPIVKADFTKEVVFELSKLKTSPQRKGSINGNRLMLHSVSQIS